MYTKNVYKHKNEDAKKKKSGKGFSVFYPEYCRVNGLETGQLMDWKT